MLATSAGLRKFTHSTSALKTAEEIRSLSSQRARVQREKGRSKKLAGGVICRSCYGPSEVKKHLPAVTV